ncbi:MAG: hypothetical protein ACK4YD_02035 [Chitinophagia bacterium]|jgi:hypothetical protein
MFMLLLLLLGGEEKNQHKNEEETDLPEADKTDTLENLFDIRLGLIEDRYLHLTKEKQEPIYFITAKSFANVPEKERVKDYNDSKLIELRQVKTLLSSWIKKLENGILKAENDKKDRDEMGNLLSEKTYIKEKRLLEKEDFLIAIRGEPRGYSMFHLQDVFENYNIVYTHYFVRLRPRDNFGFDTEYIHLILEQLTKRKLVEEFRKILADKGLKSYASFNSISIDRLRSTKIKYHPEKETQIKIIERYKNEYDKTQKQNLNFYQLEENIYRSISIND